MITPIGVDKDNHWEGDRKFVKIFKSAYGTVDVFKSSVAHVLFVFFIRSSFERVLVLSDYSRACPSASSTPTRSSPTSG